MQVLRKNEKQLYRILSCGWVMEEAQEHRGWFYRHRKAIACVLVILFLIQTPQVVNYLFPSPPREESEVTHQLTVWIQPDEEAFDLCIAFYYSEQDAIEGTNIDRTVSLVVEPLDDEQNIGYIHNLPMERVSFWLKVYFSDYSEEVFTILEIEFDQTKTITLVDREISILLQLWHGE